MSVTATITRKHINPDYYNIGAASSVGYSSSGTSEKHWEAAELTGLSDRHIEVTFNLEFTSKPLGKLEVYRYESRADGSVVKQSVLFTYPDADWLDETGFTIDIMTFESLTGVIVEYMYTE